MGSASASPSSEASSSEHSEGILADTTLVALWKNNLDHWEEDSAHQGFLDAASLAGDLAFAARMYRSVASTDQHAAKAEDQLKKITALAFAQIDATHSPPPQTKRVVTIFAFVVSMVLIGTCIYALSR